MSRPRIAVTLGDPRGIGPEITARALADPVDAEITLVGAEDQISGLPAVRRVPVGAWQGGSGEHANGGPGGVPDFARTRKAGRIAGHCQ